jgi:hypothetical protein
VIAKGLPTNVARKPGLPVVGFHLHDNMYFGQNQVAKFKAKGHRRHGTELPKIVVKHDGADDRISNT